jgi:hypothetical protein
MTAEAKGMLSVTADSSPREKRRRGVLSDTESGTHVFEVRFGMSRYSLNVWDGSG